MSHCNCEKRLFSAVAFCQAMHTAAAIVCVRCISLSWACTGGAVQRSSVVGAPGCTWVHLGTRVVVCVCVCARARLLAQPKMQRQVRVSYPVADSCVLLTGAFLLTGTVGLYSPMLQLQHPKHNLSPFAVTCASLTFRKMYNRPGTPNSQSRSRKQPRRAGIGVSSAARNLFRTPGNLLAPQVNTAQTRQLEVLQATEANRALPCAASFKDVPFENIHGLFLLRKLKAL